MLYFLSITYIISLGALLTLSDHQHSSKRFWIKLLTCIHPLLILSISLMNQTIYTVDPRLLLALIFALLGDVALGLKHRFKRAMHLGILFFSWTHIALIVLFYEKTGFIWILFVVSVIWFTFFNLFLRKLNLGAYTSLIALYAFLILVMFGMAFISLIQNMDIHHFILWLGALCFLLSDTLLSQKYFAKFKVPWVNIAYLILYHIALSLFTLSAFV